MKVIKILFVISVAFGSLRGVQAQAKNPKPNIVIILSDQQSYDDLGCYGNAQNKRHRSKENFYYLERDGDRKYW